MRQGPLFTLSCDFSVPAMSIILSLAIALVITATIIWIAARIIAALNIKIPSSLTEDIDRRQWNAQWESYLERAQFPILFYQLAYRWSSMGHSGARDSQLMGIRTNFRSMCLMQRNLTERILHAIVRDHFESRWQEAEESVRERHLLEGLVRTCAHPQGAEQSRLLCPEVTLEKLQDSQGRAFLNLLKSYILDEYSAVPKKPLLLPSGRLNDPPEAMSELDNIIREELIIDRNSFICKL